VYGNVYLARFFSTIDDTILTRNPSLSHFDMW